MSTRTMRPVQIDYGEIIKLRWKAFLMPSMLREQDIKTDLGALQPTIVLELEMKIMTHFLQDFWNLLQKLLQLILEQDLID